MLSSWCILQHLQDVYPDIRPLFSALITRECFCPSELHGLEFQFIGWRGTEERCNVVRALARQLRSSERLCSSWRLLKAICLVLVVREIKPVWLQASEHRMKLFSDIVMWSAVQSILIQASTPATFRATYVRDGARVPGQWLPWLPRWEPRTKEHHDLSHGTF